MAYGDGYGYDDDDEDEDELMEDVRLFCPFELTTSPG